MQNYGLNLDVLPVNRDDQNLIDSSALEILHKADRIIIRETSSTIKVLVLDAQPKQNLADNYSFSLRNKTEQEMLETILLENEIAYEKWVHCRWSFPCVSHDGRFTATDSIIFTSSDRNIITKRQRGPALNWGASILGWAHDDSGVYIQFSPNSYIINGGGFVMPHLFRLPQPIIKLKLPEEYR